MKTWVYRRPHISRQSALSKGIGAHEVGTPVVVPTPGGKPASFGWNVVESGPIEGITMQSGPRKGNAVESGPVTGRGS